MGRNIRIITGLAGLALASLSSAVQYAWDDGVGEFSTVSGSHQVLAVGFVSMLDQENLTSIDFFNFWEAGDGHAINYHLWTDPTNDGNMIDANLVQTISTTIDAPGPNGNWQSVAIAPTIVPVGSWFYVGISFDDPAFAYFLGGADTSAVAFGNSWVVDWDPNRPSQPGNIASGDVFHYTTADLLIRANGVPEPASFGAVSIGALALLRRRRK